MGPFRDPDRLRAETRTSFGQAYRALSSPTRLGAGVPLEERPICEAYSISGAYMTMAVWWVPLPPVTGDQWAARIFHSPSSRTKTWVALVR